MELSIINDEYFTGNVINKLKTIHPKQIINLVELKVSVFKIEYSYTTNRNNKKIGFKYMFINGVNPERDVSREFKNYIKEYNKEKPYRKVENVKILSTVCLGLALSK